MNAATRGRALLTLLATSTAAAVSPLQPQAAHVHIGALAWVYDDATLPALVNGRVQVPALHACALLGAPCTLTGATLRVGAAALPARNGTVALKALADALRLGVAWDERAKVATVALPTSGFAFDAQTLARERANGTLPPSPNVRVVTGANLLSVVGPGPLRSFTLFTPGEGGTLTYLGSLAPSTPDNPGQDPCNGQLCSVAFGPDGLRAPYAVAYVQ
ncbi:hypothetical protein [Deinococcus maricopensis]|uniref:Copper amine oxidase-like domain-containing protein n=1 Tax=Deinococcus maricopensis (strain DSM 21211 / LMG 22137 / NRRL B-23946 / LB-34) TaxID=709986 RepID=E8U5I2_DEIML|nr:hypothetical protein [Deinococcus maricopensis]ADV66321.1 hypothetical protein Deima_0664 [Deinococcus maricopensis DSM 21211]